MRLKEIQSEQSPKRSDEHHVQGAHSPQTHEVFCLISATPDELEMAEKEAALCKRRPWATTAEQHGDSAVTELQVDCPRIAHRGSKGDDSRT